MVGVFGGAGAYLEDLAIRTAEGIVTGGDEQ